MYRIDGGSGGGSSAGRDGGAAAGERSYVLSAADPTVDLGCQRPGCDRAGTHLPSALVTFDGHPPIRVAWACRLCWGCVSDADHWFSDEVAASVAARVARLRPALAGARCRRVSLMAASILSP